MRNLKIKISSAAVLFTILNFPNYNLPPLALNLLEILNSLDLGRWI